MRTTGNLVRQVEAVYLDGMLGTWSDDRLLDRFACEAGDRAERAFTAIVERHGPRVYRVCRGVAGDGPTAEDAFQATFLVLARKAGTLRVRESLGPWLHGVAARLAASARASQMRRNRHEAASAHRGEPSTTDPERDPDLHRILHAEIGRLPAAYREAVYLCDVEGLSQETVAVRLSCAIGTVRSRLSRGRKRLRSRLIRRGIVPAALAALTSRASAALPLRLAAAAARNAVAITSSGASCGMVPAAAVALFEEGMTTMLKLKVRALIGVAIVGLSATAAVVFAQDGRPGAKKGDATEARTTVAPATQPEAPKVELPGEDDRFESRFVESRGRFSPNRKREVADPTDPFKAGGQPLEIHDTPQDPPSEKEFLDAFLKQKFPDLKVRIEKVLVVVDSVKVYPLAGPCQLVHDHFQATLTYKSGIPGKAGIEVVHLEREYLRRVPNDDAHGKDISVIRRARVQAGLSGQLTAPADNESRDDGLPPARGPNRPAPRSSAARPQEVGRSPNEGIIDHQMKTDRRLDDVERKLDRILKALEKAPAESKANSNQDQPPEPETRF